MTTGAESLDLTSVYHSADGRIVTIRPIRPEDAEIEQRFVRSLSQQSRYLRFMDSLRELAPGLLNRLTHVDFEHDMALIAVVGSGAAEVQVGVARYAGDPERTGCEFAMVVADEWQGGGLARHMMQMLIDIARRRGYKTMIGYFLADNRHMLHFVDHFGFRLATHPEDAALKTGTLTLD